MDEREEKLKSVRANISKSMASAAPGKDGQCSFFLYSRFKEQECI